MAFSFIGVKKIIFGPGEIRRLGDEAESLGSRVLLVVGRSFMRRTGKLAEVENDLRAKSLDVVVFDAVPPEPSLSAVQSGIEKLLSNGCDLVVAIGGGSALDVGKAIAGLARSPAPVREYFKGREVEKKGFPFIAAATTAGSGAEVTPNAVLVDEEEGVKASIRSAYLLADVAIVDPELTLTLPPDVTAQSGMDALCQAMEAFVSRGSNPLTDALAGDAAVRLLKNLPYAHAHGDDLRVRTEVALGSLMGGMAFSNARLGLAHGMAHPLGIATGLPHGLICGLLLPAVMRFNMPVAEAKYARIAEMAGIPGDGGADALVREVERLNAVMGLHARLPELRVGKESRPTIVSQTLPSGSTKSNPRDVSAEDIERILESLQPSRMTP